MPAVTYLGPHDAVEIPDHGISAVVRGASVEVSEALAGELVARENGTQWAIATPTKAARAADKES